MKLLYTHENRFLVSNIQNIIENNNIETLLKNEFISGGAGDIAPHETWPELWLVNDEDYDKALQLIDSSFNIEGKQQWVCGQCQETNDGSFEFCWKCQTLAPYIKSPTVKPS